MALNLRKRCWKPVKVSGKGVGSAWRKAPAKLWALDLSHAFIIYERSVGLIRHIVPFFICIFVSQVWCFSCLLILPSSFLLTATSPSPLLFLSGGCLLILGRSY